MHKVVINATWGGFTLSEAAEERFKELTGREYRPWNFPRHDPILVQVVEELGAAASGEVANLEVREIKGTQYHIDEYDGYEYLYTPETMRWTTIGGE
jgi:hypothetical protein